MTGAILFASLIVTAASLAPSDAAGAECGDGFQVTLDIGHTPKRPGATSARGRPEYRFNKVLVADLAAELRHAGRFDVAILNEAGQEISMARRSREIQAITSGILLSVHHDSVQPIYLESWTVDGQRQRFSNKYRGYSLFVSSSSSAYERSRTLAVSLGTKLRKAGFTPSYHHAEDIPGERRPLLDHAAGVFRYDNLAVLRNARIPAVLFEAGVIVHQDEELDLLKPQTRSRLIEATRRGIETFCGKG